MVLKIAASLTLIAIWIVVGVGYHRLETACYESRHQLDNEPVVYGDPIGIAFNVGLWPVYLAANAANGSDCIAR